MSNTQVGNVYQQIIQDVIDSSRVDFEEGGVDEGVLEELKRGWQRKLTQLNVAAFPWDPKPEPPPPSNIGPPPAPVSTSAPAAQASYTQAQLSPPSNTLSLPGMPMNPGSPQIKSEPGLVKNEPGIKIEPGTQSQPMPPRPQGYTPGSAKDRAAQQLQNQFGDRAQASIDLLHGNRLGTPAGAAPQAPGLAGQSQPQPPYTLDQYRQAMAAQSTNQQQHMQQNGVGSSQVDGGADDFEGVLMKCDADGNTLELGRLEIDGRLHALIAAKAKRMEGGGLMLPLREAAKHSNYRAKKSHIQVPAAFDGLDDDDAEAEDDDAINSDLDDPEDDQDDDDDDDETMGNIMLCMYDKVQRVKNKWKCTLKDGVLTVNGREYVFHKATGEYEW